MHGRRATFWTRWPHEEEGPLWAGVHLHERAGVTAIVGVELFSEPPADAREGLGPSAFEGTADLLPLPPEPLLAVDLRHLSLQALVERFRASGEAAQAMAGAPGARGGRLSEEHWREVAAVAQRCRASGSRATARAVAGQWQVSRPTAKRWLAHARQRGLL